ncbi:MAG: glycosyltransferase [Cytophagales bacterium]|nr:glycosyltransferase [Cytophagales bacterium]
MASEQVNSPVFKARLGTITQTNHWLETGGEVIAYEPYVREMRVWADLFNDVEIFTPITTSPKKGSLCTYERANVSFRFARYDTRIFSWGFLVRFFQLPVVFFQMAAFIWRHDFLLIRSPGHFSFMAHILVVLFRKKSITKFAGYFGYFNGERIPSILERYFIRNFLGKRNLVLVYGKSFKPNFISYFPLLLSKHEIQQLEMLNKDRATRDIFRFYSLGRLTTVKGFDLAISGLGELYKVQPELAWHYHLIGDGPEQEKLKMLAQSLGIGDRITFEGRQPYFTAMQMIKCADAVLMPGVMEGWPKVVVEAWIAGTVPVCANAGLLPQVINNERNGYLFNPDPKSMASVCQQVFQLGTEERKEIVNRGRALALELSSDSFKRGIQDLCNQRLAIK